MKRYLASTTNGPSSGTIHQVWGRDPLQLHGLGMMHPQVVCLFGAWLFSNVKKGSNMIIVFLEKEPIQIAISATSSWSNNLQPNAKGSFGRMQETASLPPKRFLLLYGLLPSLPTSSLLGSPKRFECVSWCHCGYRWFCHFNKLVKGSSWLRRNIMSKIQEQSAVLVLQRAFSVTNGLLCHQKHLK